ncbi:MAG TPA: DUF3040 domain-containing protein [Frankiaceae bacterium]|jgi:hypothetical protein|nr:DUF3040 domain-containing protein [Frankiaceae bacterium]
MPLSEHEQRLLEQIERELYADDPKLVSTVRSINPRSYALRRLWRSAALFIVGLGVLVAAVVINSGAISVVLGLVGFLVMLLAALRGSGDLRRLGGRPDPDARSGRSRSPKSRRSVAERAQERWQRRWEDRDS